ncbi:MAG: hypothetical protein A3B86_00900 [Candidatus Yanofskybacteria bacterium RIFCSPHIGHO2_02_FULL_38_22b]|uniref:Uncharacterized protein n=1 Tax=Candidatus Yanofskybacteria bacterium RIFCSPHIGHO2_02_FULL_38_22b TaxID=1802673 RepID=A0A1F8F2C3_9BACT|nr:MAG: hypothetical protein A3B86_00900 [Candidatus Yanofskybacteria bacterium RIFCSPHIGHO2_02_FULL_38_22b]
MKNKNHHFSVMAIKRAASPQHTANNPRHIILVSSEGAERTAVKPKIPDSMLMKNFIMHLP